MINNPYVQRSSKRIPITPPTFNKLREFSRGLGVSYDETILLLMSFVADIDKDPLIAGREMRGMLDKKPEANRKRQRGRSRNG